MIQATIEETNRLDSLANNILVASQLEGGDYTRTKEVMDFSDLAEHSVREYRHRFPEREWIAGIQPGCTITGDPFLLHLMISNLLDNALKYSPKRRSCHPDPDKRRRPYPACGEGQGPGHPR